MLLPKYLNLFRLIEHFTFSVGGGGGGGSSAPTSQNVTQTTIPDYARPYAETMLGKTAALTDINQNPYQPYQENQVADFSQLQQQAMGSIGGQQVASQLGGATNLAAAAGMGGLAAQQNAMGLQNAALGYGQAGTGYGAAASQYGAEGAAAAQQAALQAQQGAQQYGAQGAQFGAQGAQFGAQGAQFGAQGAQFGKQGADFGQQGAQFGQLGSQFGTRGAEIGAQGIGIGQQGIGFGQQGAGFGSQAAAQAGAALGYGAGASDIGQAGMGYGALGAGIGARGVSAAEQGFGAGEAYRQQATSADAMGQYMSPYMQNVVAQQQKEAIRQADIARQGNQAQATRAGAFGGSRAAVMEAESQRGLQDRLAMIQATGSQSAYDKAQQAQQFASNVGLQGLQAGYQGLQTGMQGTGQAIQGAQTGISGQQAALQGVGQAGQMYGLGIQGTQAGIQGTQAGLQGVQTGMQGTAQGIQGAQAGMQGAETGIRGAQTGIQGSLAGVQGAQTGIQGAQAGIQGAGLGLQGVGQQIAAGQLGLQGAETGIRGQQAGMQGTAQGIQGVQAATGAGQYGLQGLGAAGSAASTLGALGQTQFGQEQAINQAQMQAGALQQAQEQRGLDVAYQQYQDQLNYPYKQLAFQSDMFRGLPLSQSASTMYQNTGAMAPQLVGAGIAAYGASQRVKEGGLIKGYAEGGTTTVDPSVPSSIGPQALSSRLAKLSDEQLMAYARTVKDAVALAEVKGEIQRRQEARAPQGQMPASTVAQSMMPQEAPEMPVMAGGGIVALSKGGSGEDQVEMVQNYNKVADDFKTEDLRNRLLGSAQAAAGPLGGFFHTPNRREQAREKIRTLEGATPEELWSYASSGMMPQVQYGADEGRPTSPMLAANAVASTAQAVQAQDADSQVSTGQISPQQLEAMTAAANREDMAGQQAQNADSQVQSQAAAAAPSVSPSAPPGTAPVGIAAPGVAPSAAPAGQAPAGQAPAAPAAPAGIVPSSRAPAAMATGAVPVANPGDPMGWGAYKANVDDMAKLDPEQKAVLDDMRKRTERRMSRAEKQEKNVMSETTIAMGLAMMGGLNLPDGVRRMAEQGGKKYFESSAAASKAIEAADDAQGAFDQYQLSLKQGNKKVAADMYGKYFNTMADFQGKIQSASISAGASMANAQAQREATETYRRDQIEQRNLDRDLRQKEFDIRIQQNDQQFKATMAQRQDEVVGREYAQGNQNLSNLANRLSVGTKNLQEETSNKLMMAGLAGDPAKFTPAQKKQYGVIMTDMKEKDLKLLDPLRQQREDLQQNMLALQAKVLGRDFAGGNGGFTLRGIK